VTSSNKIAYISRVRIERQRGPMRVAYLPAEKNVGYLWRAFRSGGALQGPAGRVSAARDDARLCSRSGSRVTHRNLWGRAGSAPD
jgi:hypothetical protein